MSEAFAFATTLTAELASIPCRSVTFSTAFLAVETQTPAEQLMLLVGLLEISTAASAQGAAAIAATTGMSHPVRLLVSESIAITPPGAAAVYHTRMASKEGIGTLDTIRPLARQA